MGLGSTGSRVVVLAALALVLGALREGADVLIPITYAVLAAAVLAAPTRWLREHRAPPAVAVGLVATGALLSAALALSLVGASLQSFLTDLPTYRAAIDDRWVELVTWLRSVGVDSRELLDAGQLDPGAVLASVGSLVSGAASMASDLLMIFLLAAFLLLEAETMTSKITHAFSDPEVVAAMVDTGVSLQTYLYLKTLTSAATGLIAGLGMVVLGVDHAALWGFLAFALNYIPTIGSIIAAVPPLLLAIATGGPLTAGLVAALYLAVNTVVGNVVEPRVMGDQLGLSAFVVLLALFVWGWLWGVHGMLLAVPLTVFLRELCATQDDTKWIAALMGPDAPR